MTGATASLYYQLQKQAILQQRQRLYLIALHRRRLQQQMVQIHSMAAGGLRSPLMLARYGLTPGLALGGNTDRVLFSQAGLADGRIRRPATSAAAALEEGGPGAAATAAAEYAYRERELEERAAALGLAARGVGIAGLAGIARNQAAYYAQLEQLERLELQQQHRELLQREQALARAAAAASARVGAISSAGKLLAIDRAPASGQARGRGRPRTHTQGGPPVVAPVAVAGRGVAAGRGRATK